MASVASQLIEEVTAQAQSDSLEDAREICADGIYFPNNLRTMHRRGDDDDDDDNNNNNNTIAGLKTYISIYKTSIICR